MFITHRFNNNRDITDYNNLQLNHPSLNEYSTQFVKQVKHNTINKNESFVKNITDTVYR